MINRRKLLLWIVSLLPMVGRPVRAQMMQDIVNAATPTSPSGADIISEASVQITDESGNDLIEE